MIPPEQPDWIERLTEEARILGEARMLRDEQPLTPEITAAIVQRFNEHLARVNKSQDWAARSMGMSPTVLNAVINNNYQADPEKHIRALDKWMEAQHLKEHAPRPSGFVKTRVAQQIYGAAKWAVESGCIVLVHGPAGVGKTIAAQAIRAETTGSIYISLATAGISKMAVLEQIAAAMRVPQKGTSAQLFSAVADRLRDTGRLLIVDEIHKLEGRRKDEALHTLRDLHDATQIPMIWFGMTNIARYIQAGQSKGYEPLDQLASRIGLWLDITEMAEGVDGGPGLASVEDIQKMLAAGNVKITGDGSRYLQMLANTLGAGAFRTVAKLVQLAMKMSRGEKPIDAEMLRGIQRRRLGYKATEALENQMQLRIAAA